MLRIRLTVVLAMVVVLAVTNVQAAAAGAPPSWPWAPPSWPPPSGIPHFPPEDSEYHDYQEMVDEIKGLVARAPTLAYAEVIGGSYQARDIWAVKLSDNPTVDENEPEVLLTFHQHAREHLTVEMALYIMNSMVDNYALDPTVRDMLISREIWLIPT
jgi:carboxypeptidase T